MKFKDIRVVSKFLFGLLVMVCCLPVLWPLRKLDERNHFDCSRVLPGIFGRMFEWLVDKIFSAGNFIMDRVFDLDETDRMITFITNHNKQIADECMILSLAGVAKYKFRNEIIWENSDNHDITCTLGKKNYIIRVYLNEKEVFFDLLKIKPQEEVND